MLIWTKERDSCKMSEMCTRMVHDRVFLESGELPNENCMPKGIQLNAIDTDQLNIFIVNLNICLHQK